MNNWATYTSESPEVKLGDPISEFIVKKLGSCLQTFFSPDTTVDQRTRLIKCALCQLGHKELNGKKRFKVYANRLPEDCPRVLANKCKNTEWLYDLHWYTENKGKKNGYQPTSLPLVVECEWGMKRKGDRTKEPYSAVKYDFQKLLVTNAELRLMIFKITGGKHHRKNLVLDKYFDKAIKSYRHLKKNSEFLFIAFDESGRKKHAKCFHYTKKPNGKKRNAKIGLENIN
jgi:hypothetical protein